MTVTIHGIRNCDTMKKAFSWLDANGVSYAFHDYKKQGVTRAMLERWVKAEGWEKVLNRAGTTFRKLPEEAKQDIDAEKAIALMLDQPSIIRRPILEMVLETDDAIEIGFKPERYADLFGK
ncbi:MAG: ArsC family reductase [Salaquimonas sp.]|jgi:Spx/MgsR family transcriptional regulator|nr:ArsC family reductase [Salaquimonas sp.]